MSDAHVLQASEVCVSIFLLFCPKGWKGRLKRGKKGQLPKAKLGDGASWSAIKTCWRRQQDLPFRKPLGVIR